MVFRDTHLISHNNAAFYHLPKIEIHLLAIKIHVCGIEIHFCERNAASAEAEAVCQCVTPPTEEITRI